MGDFLLPFVGIFVIPLLVGTAILWVPAIGRVVALHIPPRPATGLILGLIEDSANWHSAGFLGGERHVTGLRIDCGYSRVHVHLPNGAVAPLTWRCKAQIRAAWKAREKNIEAAKIDAGLMALASNVISSLPRPGAPT